MKHLKLALGFLTVFTYSATAWGQSCVHGEPPSDACTVPRVISGDVGQHVVLMDAFAATGALTYCGSPVGHTVWFQVTPTVTGPVSISTCHPATSYDTVLQVWSGGDDECFLLTEVACNDDTISPECANGCAGSGSRVTFHATAGTRYRFAVGSYNQNSGGCALCLGLIVTIGEACGDPPTGIVCQTARELPGDPGVHEVEIDAEDALPVTENWSCTGGVGRIAWFKFTSEVNGVAHFSTCHPTTTYDTVVRVLQGDCAGLMVERGCNDDSTTPECTNPCGTFRGSAVSFSVNEGEEYFVEVGAYGNNAAVCDLCLGATLTIVDPCDADSTPPIAAISTPPSWPASSGVLCDTTPINGSAYDPDGTFDQYAVEYMPVNGTAWIPIYSSPSQVMNGSLLGGGTWDTGGLAQGWYFLRLSTSNLCGRSSSVVVWLFVDKQFDNAVIRSPANGAVLAGGVCVDGTVWDENARAADSFTVRYAPLPPGSSFNPVDPAHPTYAGTVLNDPLASWNTRAGVVDGSYRIRLDAIDECGRSAAPQTRDIVIDNTAPIAEITSPLQCQCVDSTVVPVLGTVQDAHLAHWTLQYTGGPSHGWTEISQGTLPKLNTLLGNWDVSNLPPCDYTLRLLATDDAVIDCNGALHNQSEYLVSVSLGPCYDFDVDNDGDIDLIDYSAFEIEFTGP